MKSIYRLKKKHQYNYVYKHALSVADRNFVMLYCVSNSKPTKIGFSVNKKYGKAVARNRIRRQLKAAVSCYTESLAEGYNVIFIPRQSKEYAFADIDHSVHWLFKKAGLLS